MSSIINNIPLNMLRNGTIIDICNDLGCEIKYPNIPLNKYMKEMMEIEKKDNVSKEEKIEIRKKFDEEQKILDIKFNMLFADYMNNLTEWLVEDRWKDKYKDIDTRKLLEQVKKYYKMGTIANMADISLNTLYNYSCSHSNLSKDKENKLRSLLIGFIISYEREGKKNE